MRLIDADALDFGTIEMEGFHGLLMRVGLDRAKEIVAAAPTIDAVPVVRCKDCIHYEPCEGGKDFCCFHATGIVPDDFCSYGERKEADGNG